VLDENDDMVKYAEQLIKLAHDVFSLKIKDDIVS